MILAQAAWVILFFAKVTQVVAELFRRTSNAYIIAISDGINVAFPYLIEW